MPNATAHNNHGLQNLLDVIRLKLGVDLSGYRHQLILRHAHDRGSRLGLYNTSDYAQYLRDNESEGRLFVQSLQIGVTDFFRDEEEWAFLKRDIVPTLLQSSEQLRVWCIGCSSGQEPYSVAMLLAEEIGLEKLQTRLHIFATDINRVGLQKGRTGKYSAREVKSIPDQLLQKYFVLNGGGSYIARPELRSVITFLQHDVVHEGPLLGMDFVTMRNLLIYMNNSTQELVLKRMCDALNDKGFLFLGRAELPKTAPFEHVNHRQVFRKKVAAEGGPYWNTTKFVLMKRAFDVNPCAAPMLGGTKERNLEGVLITFV